MKFVAWYTNLNSTKNTSIVKYSYPTNIREDNTLPTLMLTILNIVFSVLNSIYLARN